MVDTISLLFIVVSAVVFVKNSLIIYSLAFEKRLQNMAPVFF